MISFFVPGTPAPGGSKRAFFNRKTGKAMVVDACAQNKPWRSDVKAFAQEAHKNGPPLQGALKLSIVFFMARPKGHFGTGRNSDKLKDSAPQYPTGKPDSTKLTRSCEDALNGVLWKDDSQIVTQSISKRYTIDGKVGALITVASME
jgi:crossover junction endodeoxyribonuclease RusA